MKYSPAQFRDAIGVSQETLRHWRKVLPVFQNRSGYAPAFSIGDLVTGAVIKCLRKKLGVNVGALANISNSLGHTLNKFPWMKMRQSLLILDMDNRSCTLQPISTEFENDCLQIVIPLQPILAELSAALLQPAKDQHPPNNFLFTDASGQYSHQARKS